MEDEPLSDASNLPPAEAAALTLTDFLKRSGLVGTGGQAKLLIQSGEVSVNGEPETRRRRKMAAGDIVELLGSRLTVGEGSPE